MIPTPALPGSGSMGIISARMTRAPLCEKSGANVQKISIYVLNRAIKGKKRSAKQNVRSLIFFRPVIRPTEFFIPE